MTCGAATSAYPLTAGSGIGRCVSWRGSEPGSALQPSTTAKPISTTSAMVTVGPAVGRSAGRLADHEPTRQAGQSHAMGGEIT